jgi:hypothetical protein
MLIPPNDYAILLLMCVGTYFIFPVQCKNLYMLLFKRKEYVVCHVIQTATRKPVTVLAIPDSKNGFQTRIWKKKTYNLNPEHSNYAENGRLHFIFLEESNMPLKTSKVEEINDSAIIYKHKGKICLNVSDDLSQVKFEPWKDADFLIYSDEIDEGMYSKSHNVLHGDQKPWMIILATLAVLIAMIGLYYSYTQVQEISPLVHAIYDKVSPQNITVMGR